MSHQTHASKNNPKEIVGWAMYDWANSAFSSTVVTTFLGPYLAALIAARPDGVITVLNKAIEPEAFFPFCVSVSVIMQIVLLPLLGSLADATNLKKRLLLGFGYAGATATMLLFFVDGGRILLGGVLFIIANLCFGAAIVFYNAFLPDIATPETQDSVSSRGFAFGYVGGGLVLGLNVVMLQLIEDQGTAVRLALASAGVWWLVFTWLFPRRRLQQRRPTKIIPAGSNLFTLSLREFWETLKEMAGEHPHTLQYLVAYLIYNDGIQTVNTVAAIFAADELGMEPAELVGIVLMIQFVAALGAILFNRIAARIGAKASVLITLVGWSLLLIYAFTFLHRAEQVWVWAFFEALVLGSSQALSRSLFSKMVSPQRESAYFSLYEISERGTSWVGPLVFGLAAQQTGSSRSALLPIITFFIVGFIILALTNVRQGIADAGNEVPTLV
ncbi:MAG: MFS transporter [Candidatus Promineifilaceae bacterium]